MIGRLDQNVITAAIARVCDALEGKAVAPAETTPKEVGIIALAAIVLTLRDEGFEIVDPFAEFETLSDKVWN